MLAVAGAAVGRNRVLAALTRRWWAAASLQASLRAVGAAAARRADERCMLIALRCLHFAAEARRNALDEEVFRCACADAHLRGWRRSSALGLWRELAVTAALMAARSLAVEEQRKRSSLSRWSESYHAAAAAALTSTLHVVPELLPATNDQRPLHRVGSLEMNTMLRSEEEAAAAEAAIMAVQPPLSPVEEGESSPSSPFAAASFDDLVPSGSLLLSTWSRAWAIRIALHKWRFIGGCLCGSTWPRSKLALKAWRSRMKFVKRRPWRIWRVAIASRRTDRAHVTSIHNTASALTARRNTAAAKEAYEMWSMAALQSKRMRQALSVPPPRLRQTIVRWKWAAKAFASQRVLARSRQVAASRRRCSRDPPPTRWPPCTVCDGWV